jgi:hypothetical protein
MGNVVGDFECLDWPSTGRTDKNVEKVCIVQIVKINEAPFWRLLTVETSSMENASEFEGRTSTFGGSPQALLPDKYKK